MCPASDSDKRGMEEDYWRSLVNAMVNARTPVFSIPQLLMAGL